MDAERQSISNKLDCEAAGKHATFNAMSIRQLLVQRLHSAGIQGVLRCVWDFTRRYGDVAHWSFEKARHGSKACIHLTLADRSRHHELAAAFGGEVNEDGVRILVDSQAQECDACAMDRSEVSVSQQRPGR